MEVSNDGGLTNEQKQIEEVEHGGRRDWNAKLVEFFVVNGRLVILVALALLIGGAFSLVSLQREGFPAVPMKILFVQTVYPGAGSEEVERQITKPLEDALEDAEGVKEISSNSMNSVSVIVVTLDAKSDIDRETQEVRNKILAVETDLPKDAEKPEIRRFETGGAAYIIGVSSLKDSGPLATELTNELSLVQGVKSVKPLVEKPKQIMIDVDPKKLAAAGLGLDRLILVLKGANVNFPVARLDLDHKSRSLVVIGALNSVDELKKVTVGFNPRMRQPVRLSDVAKVRVMTDDVEAIDRFGSQSGGRLKVRSGTLLAVNLAKGADIIRTRAKVADRLSELRRDKTISKSARVEFVLDGAKETNQQVAELISGAVGKKNNLWLLGGIQLVVIAMLLLVNFRAAILAALAIPFSLAFTFIFLMAAGITLNTIVLFSLVLVLGLIVDPAIVIIESIQRYRDLGYPPRLAVKATARRYGAGVFMATLTNWIVFLPFGVVSGIFGEIIRYIPLTVIPALVASYFIPIAILPWLAERFLKPRPVETEDEAESLWRAARAMMRANRWILARWWRQAAVILLALVLAGLSISLVATGKVRVVQFSSPEDNSLVMATATFAKGLTDHDRQAAAKTVEKGLRAEPGIESFFYQQQSRDQLVAYVRLKEKRGPKNKSKKIINRLDTTLDHHNNFEFQAIEAGYAPPESEYQIQVQLYDNNISELKSAAAKVGRYLKSVKGVVKVDDGVNSGSEPEVRLVLDRQKAEARGLGGFQVGQALKALLDKTTVTKFDDQVHDRSLDVMLRVDGDSRPKASDDLKELTLTDPTGKPVRLADIAKVEKRQSLAKIERFEGQRFLTVRARVDKDSLFKVQGKLDRWLTPKRVKALGISGKGNRGEYEDIAQSFKELFLALAIAIFLTYLVLVLQFRSFAQPMIMLFTIPPAMIGVFPVLWLLKNEFGFLELLGFTILVGIVENVAIFLIDYANQRIRQDKMDPKEAIILASGVRFRPIMLTKLVALGGLLPLAIESPFWRGMAATIIAGIGLSGIFSIVIIPILFMAIVNIERRLGFEL
ncbi:MAG: efflux RND transporter permease subunit [Actinomycetota bacterium]|nr:efflux RND transporter permease subunit [Actinomycetota bacterium]